MYAWKKSFPSLVDLTVKSPMAETFSAITQAGALMPTFTQSQSIYIEILEMLKKLNFLLTPKFSAELKQKNLFKFKIIGISRVFHFRCGATAVTPAVTGCWSFSLMSYCCSHYSLAATVTSVYFFCQTQRSRAGSPGPST